MYVIMAVWLLLAAVARIALQVAGGLDLDPLPFITGGIGLLGLLALVPAREQYRQAHSRH